MIVIESKPMLFESYQMVFEKCFKNNIEEQMISRISGDEWHCLWLQGSFNLLIRKQRANYIAVIFLCILKFFSL